jgi:hypothetical protein
MSQLIMHALDGALVPILIKAEQLQKLLAEHEGAVFADATNWIEAYLQLTCEAPHYEMLRNTMAEQSALLLIDGLDEASARRARMKQHIAEVLAHLHQQVRFWFLQVRAISLLLTFYHSRALRDSFPDSRSMQV